MRAGETGSAEAITAFNHSAVTNSQGPIMPPATVCVCVCVCMCALCMFCAFDLDSGHPATHFPWAGIEEGGSISPWKERTSEQMSRSPKACSRFFSSRLSPACWVAFSGPINMQHEGQDNSTFCLANQRGPVLHYCNVLFCTTEAHLCETLAQLPPFGTDKDIKVWNRAATANSLPRFLLFLIEDCTTLHRHPQNQLLTHTHTHTHTHPHSHSHIYKHSCPTFFCGLVTVLIFFFVSTWLCVCCLSSQMFLVMLLHLFSKFLPIINEENRK